MCFSYIFLFILWRRERTKRHPPHQASPIWEDVTAPPVALILVSSTHQRVGIGFHIPAYAAPWEGAHLQKGHLPEGQVSGINFATMFASFFCGNKP